MRELLVNSKSMVCGCLCCIVHQASRCHTAESANAQGFGSVMEVTQKVDDRGFRLVVSCDDTTEWSVTDYECFSNTLNSIL
jgi:hypothetical protein